MAPAVDHIGSKQQLIDYLSEKFGQGDKKRAFNFIAWQRYQQDMLLANLQKTGNIGLIVASGNILDGEQPEGAIGGETLARIIRKARENTAFKALVIRIDSGGGSAFASELIRQEIAITREAGIPVFISMGSIAASGGYWLATAGTEVWATPSTLTGSIGVFSIVPTFEQTLTKVGVTSDGIDTHTLAGIFHLDRPMSEQAQTVFQMAVDGIYHKFLSILAYAVHNSPCVPKGLFLLISFTYLPVRKYSVSYRMCERHCNPEFMKQVFPRFLSPTTPLREYSLLASSDSYSSDNALLGQRPS